MLPNQTTPSYWVLPNQTVPIQWHHIIRMNSNLLFYLLFNIISAISGWWADDNEKLCAMESHLWLRRFRLQRGSNLGLLELFSQPLNHWATGASLSECHSQGDNCIRMSQPVTPSDQSISSQWCFNISNNVPSSTAGTCQWCQHIRTAQASDAYSSKYSQLVTPPNQSTPPLTAESGYQNLLIFGCPE